MSVPHERESVASSYVSEHGHRHHSRHDRHKEQEHSQRREEVVEIPDDQYHYDHDDEEVLQGSQETWACNAFVEKSRRMAFVRRVLGTVGIQLAFCALLTASLLFSGDDVHKWVNKFWWLGLLGGIIWLGINIAVACCHVGRGPPSCLNVTLLVVGTLALSILCSFITSRYRDNVEIVLYALSTTVGIILVLVLITTFTKIDITGWGMYLAIAGIFLMLGSLVVGLLFAFSRISTDTKSLIGVIFSFLFVILLCFYILWDLQVIMGGRRSQLDEADWLYACLILFGDIVYLFLNLLQIFEYFNKK